MHEKKKWVVFGEIEDSDNVKVFVNKAQDGVDEPTACKTAHEMTKFYINRGLNVTIVVEGK